MVLPYLVMDFTASNHDAGASIESMLYVVSTAIAFIKCSSIALNQMKIDINVNAAIDDWLAAKDDEETWKTMKKYAPRSRILSLVLLYSAVGCFILYILVIVVINLKQIFFADPNSTNGKNVCSFSFIITISYDIPRYRDTYCDVVVRSKEAELRYQYIILVPLPCRLCRLQSIQRIGYFWFHPVL